MTCVRTGCHIYIIPTGEFAYGDAHQVDGTHFFRLVYTEFTPFSIPVLHYEVNEYAVWWDKGKGRSQHNPYGDISTLVCKNEDVISYGYEGRAIETFPYVRNL